MYKLSETKKLSSSTKKELYISAKLEDTNSPTLKTVWDSLKENAAHIINPKWDANNLYYKLLFKYNVSKKEINNVSMQVVPIVKWDQIHDEDCDEKFAESEVFNLKGSLFEFILDVINNQGYDFAETVKKEKINKFVPRLVENAYRKARDCEPRFCDDVVTSEVSKIVKREFELALPFYDVSCTRDKKHINDDDYNHWTLRIESVSDDDIPFCLQVPLYIKLNKYQEEYSYTYRFQNLKINEFSIYGDIYHNKYTLAKYEKDFFNSVRKQKEEERIRKETSLKNKQLDAKDLLALVNSELLSLGFNGNIYELVESITEDSFDVREVKNIELVEKLNQFCSYASGYVNSSNELVSVSQE